MLREAGAAEVHVRISSPPVLWPCFYGIDFATRAELVATGLRVDEIRAGIGADSLGYISLDGMVEATRQGRDRLCTACFTGVYPVPLPSPDLLGKHALETPPGAGPAVTDLRTADGTGRVDRDAEGVAVGLSVGGAGALAHP
jgi:amidophosphoribosyltransferase